MVLLMLKSFGSVVKESNSVGNNKFNYNGPLAVVRYLDYVGVYSFDEDSGIFYGQVTNTRDVITFQSEDKENMTTEMMNSIELHLQYNKKRGRIVR